MNFLLRIAVLLSIVPFEEGTNFSSTLHVFAAKYEPYLYGNDQNHINKGIEYMLIKTIADKLNISIVFRSTSRNNLSRWNPSSEYKYHRSF